MQKISEVARVELLAPAGKWDVLEAVIGAGADAVYLGGKKFNMRLHRKDYNFTEDELKSAAEYAHQRGAKIYVTVNNLLTDTEMQELPKYLSFLEEIAVDALIVQDLGVVKIAKDIGLTIPLHGSVMMNAHNLEGLKMLEGLGISRVILGRELTLDDIKLMKTRTSLELEYFTHGDMCFAQSSQCYHSGMLFGKSSNRGRCMKPCRWAFDLVDRESGEVIPVKVPGPYFLAVKDMCLLPYLPEVISSGICSLKLEGRMRPADYLAALVGFYRRALDRYYQDPVGYTMDWDDFHELEKMRVRDFSPLYAFGNPGTDSVGYTAEREPRFFSNAIKEPEITADNFKDSPLPLPKETKNTAKPLLAVKVGSKSAALAALDNGADLLYTSGESFLSMDKPWEFSDYPDIVSRARELGKRVVIGLPRITMPWEMNSTLLFLEKIRELDPDGVLVTNLGTIFAAFQNTALPLYADYSCNIANQEAAKLLKDYRVALITAPLEFCCEDILAMPGEHLPMEAVIHGLLPTMVSDHCLPAALLTEKTKHQFCGAPCHKRNYGLKDTAGQVHILEMDQDCRNHIYLANELALLPYLRSFYGAGFASLRLEIPLYKADETAAVTRVYRKELDKLWEDVDTYTFEESSWQQLTEIRNVPLGTGPYTTGVKARENQKESEKQ